MKVPAKPHRKASIIILQYKPCSLKKKKSCFWSCHLSWLNQHWSLQRLRQVFLWVNIYMEVETISLWSTNTGHQNNITKQLHPKQLSLLQLISSHWTVVEVVFGSLKKRLIPKCACYTMNAILYFVFVQHHCKMKMWPTKSDLTS